MNHLKYEPTILTLSYEELEEIVQEYKNGNKEVTDKLIGGFWKFMQKYIRVVSSGKADITDRNIRQFIQLFMTKEEGSVTYQFRKNKKAQQDFLKAVENVAYLFSSVSYEELMHEAILTLLTLVERYNSKGNFFHTYVSRVFHYQYYRQLRELLLLNASNKRISFSDDEYIDDSGEYIDSIIEDSRFLINEPLDEINDNWINGLTAGEVFEDLTPTQRRILKYHYEDDLKDEDIARIMGVCRATVNRRRLAAVKLVKAQLENLNGLER